MKVLVIGGSGFVGRHVVPDLVDKGHVVAVLGRQEHAWIAELQAQSIVGDRRHLRDSARAIAAFGPEVVVDLILSSGARARELVDVVRGVARRLVVVSSMDVYRACGVLHGIEHGPLEPLPLTEESPLRTGRQTYPVERVRQLQTVFGWLDEDYDKIDVEEAVLAASDLTPTVLRFPMVYGPGDRLHRLGQTVKRMDDARPAIVIQETVASWRSPRGYVGDVGHAVVLAALAADTRNRIYNVAEAVCHSEREWLASVARVAGWDGRVVELPADRTPDHLRMPGRLEQHWLVDSSRIRAELGYRELIPRDEALRRTIAWERETRSGNPANDRREYYAEDSALRSAGVVMRESGSQ